MPIQFKDGPPEAHHMLEQAQRFGIEFRTTDERAKFLEFMEEVYRYGANFGFDSAVRSILLSGKVMVRQEPLSDYDIKLHLWDHNSDLGWGNLTEIVAEIETLHGIREKPPRKAH
jgi:hypothetical protein